LAAVGIRKRPRNFYGPTHRVAVYNLIIIELNSTRNSTTFNRLWAQEGPGDATTTRTMADNDKYSIPRFEGPRDNFLFWQARIEAYLEEKNAKAALTRLAMLTDEDKTEGSVACSVILRGLGDIPLAAVIKHRSDAKKMWDALIERYAGTNTFNKANVQTAIAKLRYTGQRMDQFVAEYEHLAAKLDAMDASMDESMLITLFFQAFTGNAGNKYAAVIAALQTKDTLTWLQATSRMLQEYEMRAGQRAGGNSDTETALNVNIRCYYCKKKGHKKAECRKRKSDIKKSKKKSGEEDGTEVEHAMTAHAVVDHARYDGATRRKYLGSDC